MFCQKGRNFNYISPELPLYSFYCSYLWTRIKQFHQNCKTTKHTTNCSREILQQDETEILPHTGKLKKNWTFQVNNFKLSRPRNMIKQFHWNYMTNTKSSVRLPKKKNYRPMIKTLTWKGWNAWNRKKSKQLEIENLNWSKSNSRAQAIKYLSVQ